MSFHISIVPIQRLISERKKINERGKRVSVVTNVTILFYFFCLNGDFKYIGGDT